MAILGELHHGAGGFNQLQSAGYTGNNDRVAAALNHIFAPEIAVLGMSTQINGGLFNAQFSSQNVAAAEGFSKGNGAGIQ